MTEAAMRLLDNSEGFFLQVEGGAIDWANHGGAGERMIEEQIDFNNTVQAVIDWVGANSSWEETLLLVTADHECGHLWGPDSAADNAFNPLVNNGVGNVPDHEYGLYWDGSQWVRYGSHSNALVPLWALGYGSELFDDYLGAVDPDGQFMNGTDDIYGPYIDNTNMFDVMNTVAPEPATLGILAAGTVGLLIRRRRRRC
jgi:alkaline phosphatase